MRRRHDLCEVHQIQRQVPDVNFHSVETPDRNFDLKGLSAAHVLLNGGGTMGRLPASSVACCDPSVIGTPLLNEPGELGETG